MAVLENLEPKKVFHFFEEISEVPRGTFNIKGISDYCTKFAKDRNLEVVQDEVGNVVIKKPGTTGYENSAPLFCKVTWTWFVKNVRTAIMILQKIHWSFRLWMEML